AHADRGHEHEVEPRMPAEEGGKACFTALEEIACREREEPGEEQKNHQEDVGHRAGEVRHQLALRNGPDISHDLNSGPGPDLFPVLAPISFTVSGRVIRRKTSSSSPRSLYMP